MHYNKEKIINLTACRLPLVQGNNDGINGGLFTYTTVDQTRDTCTKPATKGD